MTEENAALFQWGVVIAASLVAAIWDIYSRRIPNVLTLPLLAAGFIQAAMCFGWGGFKSAFAACVILAIPYVLLFLFAGGGAGDAKLMGAIGAWLGFSSGIVALFAVSVCAIVFALLKAACHQQFFAVLRNIRVMIVTFLLLFTLQGVQKAAAAALSPDAGEQTPLTMPYGPAIFSGVCAAAVYSLVMY